MSNNASALSNMCTAPPPPPNTYTNTWKQDVIKQSSNNCSMFSNEHDCISTTGVERKKQCCITTALVMGAACLPASTNMNMHCEHSSPWRNHWWECWLRFMAQSIFIGVFTSFQEHFNLTRKVSFSSYNIAYSVLELIYIIDWKTEQSPNIKESLPYS